MDPELDEMFLNLCELFRIYREHKNLTKKRKIAEVLKRIHKPRIGITVKELFRRTKISLSTFNMLFNLVIKAMRKSQRKVDHEERLSITLQYLATGEPMCEIWKRYKLQKMTVRSIIFETCEIIWRILSPTFVGQPTNTNYQRIARDFLDKWNVPNCVGALDGKRITIKYATDPQSVYKKSTSSIVLMAACDAKHLFTAVGIGNYTSQTDEGIFQLSSFGQALMHNTLPLPPPAPLSNASPKCFPYYFIGNSAFPLRSNLMRPYNGSDMTRIKEIFNYRLLYAHRVIENSFGVLIARWRVLSTTIENNPKHCEMIILACIALHNFMMLNDTDGLYCPKNYVDRMQKGRVVNVGQWRREINNIRCLPAAKSVVYRESFQLREMLANYFVNEGALPHQDKLVSMSSK